MMTDNQKASKQEEVPILLRHDYKTYFILGEELNLFYDPSAAHHITVAETNEVLYYFGDESDDISAAIIAWQEINNRLLTNEELKQILLDNNPI